MKDLLIEFNSFFELWIDLKKTAVRENDDSTYIFFLKEAKTCLSKLYLKVNNESKQEFLNQILKLLSCEIAENSIKYKESIIPF